MRPIPLSVVALLALAVTSTTAVAAQAEKKSADQEEKANIWVFPVEAIKSAMTMSAKAFNETYPGINVSNTGLTDEGYYVRYEHHGLVYYFGPIDDVATAVKWRSDMELLRTRLVEKRPELDSSTVYLVKIDPDYMYGGGASATGGSEP